MCVRACARVHARACIFPRACVFQCQTCCLCIPKPLCLLQCQSLPAPHIRAGGRGRVLLEPRHVYFVPPDSGHSSVLAGKQY